MCPSESLPPAHYDALIHGAVDAVIVVDQRRHIVVFNRTAERLFACDASAVLGQPLATLLTEPRGRRDGDPDAIIAPMRASTNRIFRARRSDGLAFTVEA